MTTRTTSAIGRREKDIAGLDLLLEPGACDALVNGQIVDAYLRYKPGVSCVMTATLLREGRNPLPIVAQAYAPGARAKLDKTLARTDDVVALDTEHLLVVTGWSADRHLPALARLADPAWRFRLFAAAGLRAPCDSTPLVLRHNPHRRAVVRLGRSGPLARVVPPGHEEDVAAGYRFLAPARPLTPTLLHVDRRGVVLVDFLAGVPADRLPLSHDLSFQVGRTLAQLHLSEPSGRRGAGPASLTRCQVPDLLDYLLPDLGAQAHRIVERCPGEPASEPCAIHGDFSLDQVVLGPGGPAMIDIDQAGWGDAADDLASFIAAEVLTERAPSPREDPLIDAFLAGYRSYRPLPDGLWPATARHLVRRAVEPFRRRHPRWPERAAALVEEAAALAPSGADGRRGRPLLRPTTPALVAPELWREYGLEICAIVPRSRDHVLVTGTIEGKVAGAQWFAPALVAAANRAAGRDARLVKADGGGCVVVHRDGRDASLPRLAALAALPAARLITHRPSRRGVVALLGGTYAKVTARDHPRPMRLTGSFATPIVLSHEPRLLRTAALPGQSLHQLLADGGEPAVSAHLFRVGRALALFHADRGLSLAPHSALAEAAVARRWLEFAQHFGAQIDAGALADRVDAALAATDDHPGVRSHRDLHDKQLILDPDREPGLLDFDLAARAHPALDLANLLVHLELRALQRHCPEQLAFAAAEALVDGYRPSAAVRHALPAYVLASRARLVGVYSLRPRHPSVPGALLDRLAAPVPGC